MRLDRLLTRSYRDAANRRLAKHLIHERPYLFTFLYCPGLDATNNAANAAGGICGRMPRAGLCRVDEFAPVDIGVHVEADAA